MAEKVMAKPKRLWPTSWGLMLPLCNTGAESSLFRAKQLLKFAFIQAERAACPVIVLCEALELSTSAFYEWSNTQSKTVCNEKDAEDEASVREVFEKSQQTYGKRRIKQSLSKQGQIISLERVSKLMKEENLVPKTVKKFKQTTDSDHQYPVAPNRLENGFNVETPNKS